MTQPVRLAPSAANFFCNSRNQLPVGEFDMVGPTALGMKMPAEASEMAVFFRARRIWGESISQHGSWDHAARHARLFR
jgi:hypothetical protein